MTLRQPFTELVLFVTNQCNLRCDYCYESIQKHGVLSQEIGERVIVWFAAQARQTPRKPTIAFYGGEPMLQFPLIKQLIDFSETEAHKYKQSVRFGLTTNGTLLSKEALQFFQRKNVDLIVSLDGDEKTHDRFRKTASRQGSFARINEMIPDLLVYRPESFIRMTVNPETVQDLSHNFEYLVALGFRNLAPVPNIQARWKEKHWQVFDVECRKIANIYLRYIMSGEQLTISFLRDGIKHLLRGKRPLGACGAGKTLVAASIDGTLYPCHRFVSSRNFTGSHKIGNIFTGIDEEARRPFARYTSRQCLGCYSPCNQCPGNTICGGGCISKGDDFNKNFLLPLRTEQYMNSIWASIAKDVIEYLDHNNPPALNEMNLETRRSMKGEKEECSCSVT